MLPYTGDYIEHIEPGKNSLKFYSFTPRPLMRGQVNSFPPHGRHVHDAFPGPWPLRFRRPPT